MRPRRVDDIFKLKGNRRMEFHCQGQRTSHLFRSMLIKEARMRKDWGDDGLNQGDGKKPYI